MILIWEENEKFFYEKQIKNGEIMKKDILDILCCPTCKKDLSLKVEKENKGEIITGALTCKHCKTTYSIEDGIPNLLPKEK